MGPYLCSGAEAEGCFKSTETAHMVLALDWRMQLASISNMARVETRVLP